MKRICIATSTRADWGILSPLAALLRDTPGIVLQILATNMHLLDSYGHTVDEIEEAGFQVDARVEMHDSDGEGAVGRAVAMSECLSGSALAFNKLCPDAVIILGDRYEMLAVASAACLMRIPIIHISGGETTRGAIDDAIRHAISQLASLHLVSAEPYRQKVISLGKSADTVINTGSLGVWNMVSRVPMDRSGLCHDLGIDPERPFVVATFHPATLDSESPAKRCRAMLDTLDRFPGLQVILTYPNNDPGSEDIIAEITRWTAENSHRAVLVKSLGLKLYSAAIREAEFVIGNSSSGIIEVPAVGTPVINMGIRQRGRLHGEGVIDCADDTASIASAIRKALSPEFKEIASKADNPYCQPDTLQKSLKAILGFLS